MKYKNYILLLVLLLLAGGAWGYDNYFKEWQASIGQQTNYLKEINLDSVKDIKITTGSSTTVLKKTGDDWLVEGEGKFKVMPSLINLAIDKLKEAKNSDLILVSNNKDKKADFELNNPIALTVSDGDRESIFEIGKMTANYQGSFVGHKGSEKSYKFDSANLRAIFDREEWRDMTLFAQSENEIDFLRIQAGKAENKITKNKNDWTSGKTKFNGEKIEKLIATLKTATAIDIPKQDFKISGLESPEAIFQFKSKDIDNTLIIGKKSGKDKYFVKTGSSDNLYLVSEATHSQLVSDINKLK